MSQTETERAGLEEVDPTQWRVGVVDVLADPGPTDEELAGLAAEEPVGERAANQHGIRAMRFALTQFGVRERPRRSSDNPYSRYFGYGPQDWCADFVSWAFDSTGVKDGKVPWGYPSAVKSINNWARAQDRFRPAAAPGYVFTYRNNKHTGFVVAAFGRYFATIEGNTGGPGDTDRGTWVNSHVRDASGGQYYFVEMPD